MLSGLWEAPGQDVSQSGTPYGGQFCLSTILSILFRLSVSILATFAEPFIQGPSQTLLYFAAHKRDKFVLCALPQAELGQGC